MNPSRATCRIALTLAVSLPVVSLADSVGCVLEAELVSEVTSTGRLGRTPRHRERIFVGDVVVTGPPPPRSDVEATGSPRSANDGSRLTADFFDQTILQMGPNSELRVTDQPDTPEGFRSHFSLREGKVRVVSRQGSEVKTRNGAVASIATDYVVFYDPATDRTEVIVLDGLVRVTNLLDPDAAGVVVGANQTTRIDGDSGPLPPLPVDPAAFSSLVASFRFVGGGGPEGLSVDHPSLTDPIATTGIDSAGWTGLDDVPELPAGDGPPLVDLGGGLLIDLFPD